MPTDDAGALHAQPQLDGGVAPVFVAELDDPSPPPLPRLFEGELSSYHLSRADDEPLSSTLQQRQIPLWLGRVGGRQRIAPLQALKTKTRYTLVTQPQHAKAFTTAAQPVQWVRSWPPQTASRVAVYCAAPPPGEQAVDLGFARLSAAAAGGNPGPVRPTALGDGTAATWQMLPGRTQCGLLSVAGRVEPGGALSRSSYFQRLAQPTLFDGQRVTGEHLEAVSCSAQQWPLLLGCIQIDDDRITLSSALDLVWWFEGDWDVALGTTAQNSAVLFGLQPDTQYTLHVQALAKDGTRWSARPLLRTAQARPHVVINEVLANPLGQEPEQEWVELHNDGSSPVDLAGYVLRDEGGQSSLPAATLEPGGYALVVNDKFELSAAPEVAPGADVLLLRVPQLGRGGLANAGEVLQLVSPTGQSLSTFAAQPKPQAGLTVARSTPQAPDAALGSFVVTEPTPGVANAVSSNNASSGAGHGASQE